jgi:sporulation protein YlmC with PRC-barrel domain
MKNIFAIALLSAIFSICVSGNANAQVAGSDAKQAVGSTTSGIVTTDTRAIVVGWSTKRGLLGKSVFNETAQKVGTVVDLIVTRDNNTPYLIIGAGGFVGIGRHDVAVPISVVHEQGQRLVWAGATRENVKSMPHIMYAKNTALRDEYIANVEAEIKKAQALVVETQKKAAEATGEVKAKLDQQVAELKQTLKATEEKLAAMKRVAVHRWKEFERDVNAALATLRQVIERTKG